MDDFETLTNFQNLYDSYRVSMRGTIKSAAAARFSVSALENLCIMKSQLLDRTYRISPYREFVVTEPKKRVIKSGAFRDKVLQHCLCDYVMLPKLRDVFIEDNYAGQIGKGTLFGLNRLSRHLTSYYRRYGSGGYILKCDVTKFFYSIDHSLMKQCIRRYFDDPGIQWICDQFVDSTTGPGLPLGNQCSQVFALMYLDELDHYVTERLRCSYYGRYMDDFYLISGDREYLKWCLSAIRGFLLSRKLTLNTKTEIVPMRRGIRFLGFHSYLTEDGKVIRRLAGDKKRNAKRKIRRDVKLVASGEMSRETFNEKYNSWRNHASHGNCYKLIQSMDAYVEWLLSVE